jgi:hypothetical protein
LLLVIIDALTRVNMNNDQESTENADYIRNNEGKMLQRTTLLSNVILPTPLKDSIRKQSLANKILEPVHRQNELDVLRLKISELIVLR